MGQVLPVKTAEPAPLQVLLLTRKGSWPTSESAHDPVPSVRPPGTLPSPSVFPASSLYSHDSHAHTKWHEEVGWATLGFPRMLHSQEVWLWLPVTHCWGYVISTIVRWHTIPLGKGSSNGIAPADPPVSQGPASAMYPSTHFRNHTTPPSPSSLVLPSPFRGANGDAGRFLGKLPIFPNRTQTPTPY